MPKKGDRKDLRAPDSLERVDRLLEHRGRLGICVLLSQSDALSFRRLKQLLGETDGSLGAQLRKLEESEYLTVRKEFVDRKPVSWYTLTRRGRQALRSHLAAMADLLAVSGTTTRVPL
jgi:DNA-binding HxlR family transcriptional regulator